MLVPSSNVGATTQNDRVMLIYEGKTSKESIKLVKKTESQIARPVKFDKFRLRPVYNHALSGEHTPHTALRCCRPLCRWSMFVGSRIKTCGRPSRSPSFMLALGFNVWLGCWCITHMSCGRCQLVCLATVEKSVGGGEQVALPTPRSVTQPHPVIYATTGEAAVAYITALDMLLHPYL